MGLLLELGTLSQTYPLYLGGLRENVGGHVDKLSPRSRKPSIPPSPGPRHGQSQVSPLAANCPSGWTLKTDHTMGRKTL